MAKRCTWLAEVLWVGEMFICVLYVGDTTYYACIQGCVYFLACSDCLGLLLLIHSTLFELHVPFLVLSVLHAFLVRLWSPLVLSAALA